MSVHSHPCYQLLRNLGKHILGQHHLAVATVGCPCAQVATELFVLIVWLVCERSEAREQGRTKMNILNCTVQYLMLKQEDKEKQ